MATYRINLAYSQHGSRSIQTFIEAEDAINWTDEFQVPIDFYGYFQPAQSMGFPTRGTEEWTKSLRADFRLLQAFAVRQAAVEAL
ncbi:hypothetical protein ColTof4_03776 [Colletotrichum tofieldiae]|nr:hypothetical protein ColTof3_12795 [Colletotrichum tofieldiae]GKT71353.1 hypothetical protein ColTof4_03776 [Colletotrichum tofieldiae]